MKPKPIVFINLPITDMSENDDFMRFGKDSRKAMPDYHVIVAMSDIKEIDIKVFYEKDFNKVKFDELKEIVKSNIKPCPK